MKFALVRKEPSEAMVEAGRAGPEMSLHHMHLRMLLASEPPTDAELDDLRIAMWGSLKEPRRDLIEHAHWERTIQRQNDMMRAFLAALGDKHD